MLVFSTESDIVGSPMVTREAILSEIRRLAQDHDGRIGMRAFLRATGIPEKQILGKHWATWNDALTEAGIRTATFTRPRTPEEPVLEALAQLIATLRKWPTENELSLARRSDSSFPSLKVIRRLRAEGALPAKLQAHCAARPDLDVVREIAAQQASIAPAHDAPYDRAPVQGYVYMMRTGRRYKIGRSNSPTRRHREVRLDLPDPTHLVHSIETDDPRGFFAAANVPNGYVRIRRTAGTAPWYAYGVINDGGSPGQRTGDGSYVPGTTP